MTESFQVFHSLEEASGNFGPCAVTIGNFDGVHAGHRRIMRRVVEIAGANGWTPSAMTFDPHPTRVVAPSKAPRLLTTTGQRASLMAGLGIRQVLVLPFTVEIANLGPAEFVERILHRCLGARAVLVGENFRFGAQQAGDVSTLAALGGRFGFITEVVTGVKRHGLMVSSSGVRTAVREGRVGIAWRFLERPYFVEGEIVSGQGIGSRQTVPTLNLSTSAELIPASGVYVTRTYDDDLKREWDSITNIGTRPTFDGRSRSIETYLLSPFDGRSPRRIRLEFLYRVRDERKFNSAADLRDRILRDANCARRFFRRLRRFVPTC